MKSKKKNHAAKPAKIILGKTANAVDMEEKSPKSFLFPVVLFLACFILADLLAILYFSPKTVKTAEQNKPPSISAAPYSNPEFEKMKNLPIGGKLEKKLPVVNDLKFIMSDEPLFAGKNPVYSLNVCCIAGFSKEFYTAKMPWAFIMYDFEPSLPTVALFEMDSEKHEGKFEIVILDPKANMESLKAVDVRIFTELVKQYKPGLVWRGSVRQEIN